MSPLFLVNWHTVHARFRGLMWLIALALGLVIMLNSVPAASAPPVHSSRILVPHVSTSKIRPAQ